VVLFLLAMAKAILLIGAEKNLFQDHWRWSGQKPTWVNWTNFVGFNLLLLLSFISFGSGTRQSRPAHIRLLNLGFLFVGCVLVAFSLHNGSTNCFEPMLDGILPFRSVYSYWLLAFFFGSPWIVLYLLGYGVAYYLLWRRSLEWRSFYFMGVLAVIFTCLNFRWLVEENRALMAINCFGVASLISASLNRKRALNFAAQCLPLGSLIAVWLLLKGNGAAIASPAPYVLIVLSFALLFFFLPAIPLKAWPGGVRLSHWLPFFFITFLLLSNQWYRMANNYNKLIVYALALPHYLFAEIVIVFLLGWMTWLASRWIGRKSLWFFDLGAVLLILMAAADLKLDQTVASRLDWNVLTQCDSLILLLRTLQPYWAVCITAILAVCTFYAAAVYGTKRIAGTVHIERSDIVSRWSFCLFLFLLVGVFSSILISPGKVEGFALTNILLTSPLLPSSDSKKLSSGEFNQLVTDLHLRHPAPTTTVDPSVKKTNVLLVVLESTYNKYLSLFGGEDETQPLLRKYKDRMELFPNFYSTFPSSFNARFTVLSGLYPIREPVSRVNPHINAKSIIELLHERGYATSIYQSDPREYLRFNDYLANRGIDNHYDCSNMPGREKFESVAWGVPEQATMEAITNQFSTVAATGKPFFIAYFPVAPHMPYDTPLKGFKKFPSKLQPFVNMDHSGEYKNTLLYIDWILSKMLDAIDQNGLIDDTLVIITNDHGEMIGDEDGKLGHGWRLKPDLCVTPLIILNPSRKGYRVNYALGSQVDLLPTMASLLNMPLPAGELYEGASLYDESANANKTVYLNSTAQRALIRDGKYYWEESPDSEPAVYKISFQGTKTLFEKTSERADMSPVLNKFDRFQNSLIRHYQSYKRQDFGSMLMTTNLAGASAKPMK
jgi:glucan phosphoethanolaminetransferase (alkaline phosphatase superfamily)